MDRESFIASMIACDWFEDEHTDEIRASLGDQIVALFKAGKMPNPMSTDDVHKRFGGKYASQYINVVLAKYEKTTGDYVKRGRKALFRRVSEGRYVAI